MYREDPGKVLFAAAVGFAAGILFAPKSGRETREQLQRQAQTMKTRAGETAGDLRHKAEVGKERLQSAAAKVRRHGKEAKEEVDDELRRADDEMNNGL